MSAALREQARPGGHSRREWAIVAALGALMLTLWVIVGSRLYATPMVGTATTYDYIVFHHAGELLIQGGDPYGPEFAAWKGTRSAYAYPLPSLLPVLPLLAFPVPVAAALWIALGAAALVATPYLLRPDAGRWAWAAALLFYPSLYALRTTQWAPLLIGFTALSVGLYRRGLPFWAGLVLPLATLKPSSGLALLAFAAILCWRDRRWWLGCLAGGLLWYGGSLAAMPDWPLRWLNALNNYADPSDGQNMVSLSQTLDGALCLAAAALLAGWCLWRRRQAGLACALLIAVMLVVPFRAQYDYPTFMLPLLLLGPRRWPLVLAAIAASWLFPLSYELGVRALWQLSLCVVAPCLAAAWLVALDEPATPAARP